MLFGEIHLTGAIWIYDTSEIKQAFTKHLKSSCKLYSNRHFLKYFSQEATYNKISTK